MIRSGYERTLKVTFRGIHAYAIFAKEKGSWRLVSCGKPLAWMSREPSVEAIAARLESQRDAGLTWEWLPKP